MDEAPTGSLESTGRDWHQLGTYFGQDSAYANLGVSAYFPMGWREAILPVARAFKYCTLCVVGCSLYGAIYSL
jgi:hypothetical protein